MGRYARIAAVSSAFRKMQGKSTRVWPLQVLRLPQTLHRSHGDHLRVLAYPAASLVAGDPSAVLFSKKGISSNQLHRTLGITLKSAWFLSHRIREAMRDGSLAPMGGNGGVVEVDETYIGKASFAEGKEPVSGPYHKRTILGLVERGGRVRTFHAEGARAQEIAPIVRENLAREAKIMTDESKIYTKLGAEFSAHFTVNHSAEEWARYTNVRMFPKGEEFVIHTNTIEGYFSIFKRGMKGIYQHCSEKHLHRYLAEFDFRYSNRIKLGCDDSDRAHRALLGVKGKRLTYQTTRH